MKVLIVDDDSTNLLLHKTIVRKLAPDTIIRTASNAEEALKEFMTSSGIFDFVITDYQMPGMNGYELIKEMKKYQPFLISVCITSDSKFNHEHEFDLCLQKPVTREDFTFCKERMRTNLIKLLMQRRNGKTDS